MSLAGARMPQLCAALAAASALLACGGHGTRAASRASGSGPAGPQATESKLPPVGDWTMFDFDPARTGVDPESTGITASNLGSLQRRVVHLGGTVDSSPVQIHGVRVAGRVRDVAVMTTSYGKTIAIDPGTGAKLWQFVPSSLHSYQGSEQVTTATPVVDRRFVYASSPDGLIHKLALNSGRQVRGRHWPARITFDPTREKIASALNLTRRYVVAATGGYYGDAPTYQGHVALIDRRSGRVTHVWNALCSSRHHLIRPPSRCGASDAAVWSRAGAVIIPGSGRILIATGNGPFNGSTNWGDSVLELSANAGRLLHNWTPVNEASLNTSDTDVGSSSPAVLPVRGGRRLAVQGDKEGKLYLLSLSRLNGTRGGPGARKGGQLQRISAPGGAMVYTAPAVWTHRGQVYVFVATEAGTAAYVLRGGRLHVAWFDGTPGTSPVVAGGLLYVYNQSAGTLVIRAPESGSRLRTLPAGHGHWNSPIVVDGRIILPEGDYMDHSSSGTLSIYHLPGR
ncbi:MAG: PQQ-binding-like beta-propeller repeat protein [Solirubrobacterales bacterium]|nr:PQQ-binding-like beta-propeller repeat protein [Solirubrobacterales bacterium]